MSDTLFKLVNPEFDFQFGDKTYRIRKATLEKFILFQKRAKEMTSDGSEAGIVEKNFRLLAFCISLMLRDQDPSVTEDFVMQYISPTSLDVEETLRTLGFMSPKKAEGASKEAEQKQTTDQSSPQS